MFSIFKRKSNALTFPYYLLKTDMHSHLIPAVDDGSQNEDESLFLIRGMMELGFEKLINTDTIQFGAEYFLDDHVLELMEKNTPLLTIKDKMVLVEISFASPPLGLKEMIFDLQIKGYQPILAHPERYTFYHRTPSIYQELKETGVLFQSNLLSFSGYYGGSVKDAAEYLANNDLLDLLGTDLHHDRHLNQLRELPFTHALQKAVGRGLLNPDL